MWQVVSSANQEGRHHNTMVVVLLSSEAFQLWMWDVDVDVIWPGYDLQAIALL